MIVSVINEKGGSGKTSLAINLACKLNDEGDKVLLLDLDPQRSAEVFVSIRKSEKLKEAFAYERKLIDLKSYDSVIIDTGG
ncbi:ParA family protein, partial [Campylobacter upsaliensis]|nr:ParA family protein [Campylobacter upsaliensis]